MPSPHAPLPEAAAPAGRRRLTPQVRMAQILDAALAEFSERGYAATTMDDIARRSGLRHSCPDKRARQHCRLDFHNSPSRSLCALGACRPAIVRLW